MPAVSYTLVTPFPPAEAQRKLNEALPRSRYAGVVPGSGNFRLVNKSEIDGRFSSLNLLPEMTGIFSDDFRLSKLVIRIHTKHGFFRNYAWYLIIFGGAVASMIFGHMRKLPHADGVFYAKATLFWIMIVAIMPALEFFTEIRRYRSFLNLTLQTAKADAAV